MRYFFTSLVLLPLFGFGCVVREETATPPAESTTTGQVIEYQDGVFTPAELAIPVGTTVTFKNLGTQSVWPASGMHPTHLLCPGFDSLRPLGPLENYSFTFQTAKTCPFHNHLSATEFGRIIVE